MAQKSSGSQQGARDKLSKTVGDSTTVNEHLKEFEEDETARIQLNPSVTEGRVHVRYHGRNVKVTGKRGEAYEVELKDGGKKDKNSIHQTCTPQKVEE